MAGMTAADVTPAPNVAIITPLAGTNSVVVAGNGAVGVSSSVDLVTQVTGRIARMDPAMVVGGAFEAGDILVELEQDEFLLNCAKLEPMWKCRWLTYCCKGQRVTPLCAITLWLIRIKPYPA